MDVLGEASDLQEGPGPRVGRLDAQPEASVERRGTPGSTARAIGLRGLHLVEGEGDLRC